MNKEIVKFVEVVTHYSMCNLKCHYCYLAQQGVTTNHKADFRFDLDRMLVSVKPERMGGICLFNFCADGETMLDRTTMDFIKGVLSQGHYVNIVTNGTIKKGFEEILTWDKSSREHILFITSLHYLELKRLGLLDDYFDNLRRAREAGCSFYMSLVFCDDYIKILPEIKTVCMDKIGVLPQAVRARNDLQDMIVLSNMDVDEYYDLGIKQLDSTLFRFEKEMYNRKIGEFCYAGDWFFNLDLNTGNVRACYEQPIMFNLFEKPERPLPLCAIGNHCKVPYCYNGISRLTLGVVPEVDKFGSYWSYRSRTTENGDSTFTEQFKNATEVKLYRTNNEYSNDEKKHANRKYVLFYGNLAAFLYRRIRFQRGKIKELFKRV